MKKASPEQETLLAEYREFLVASGSNTPASAATSVSNVRRLLREVEPLTADTLRVYLDQCPSTSGTLRSCWVAWTSFCEDKGLPTVPIERRRGMDAPWIGFQVAIPALAAAGLSAEQMAALHYMPMQPTDPFYPHLLVQHPELADGAKVALWGPRPERQSLREPLKPRIFFVIPAAVIFALAPYHGNKLPDENAPLLPLAPGSQRALSPRAIRRILAWVNAKAEFARKNGGAV